MDLVGGSTFRDVLTGLLIGGATVFLLYEFNQKRKVNKRNAVLKNFVQKTGIGKHDKIVRRMEKEDPTGVIRVMQWNTLADYLCTAESFPHSNPTALNWEKRKEGLLDEILSSSPDLIGLEEVDHYYDFYYPELIQRGYGGIFKKKTEESSEDGCALFYNTEKFSEAETEMVEYGKDRSQVAILCKLISLDYKEVVFAVTHLKAKPGFEAVRKEQGEMLLQKIAKFNNNNSPVIIAGDFNDEPLSEVCQLFEEKFNSAYRSKEIYTTYKKRSEVTKRTIDYIWYSQKFMKVHQLLDIPDVETLADYFPSTEYPSDHLALVAEFTRV